MSATETADEANGRRAGVSETPAERHHRCDREDRDPPHATSTRVATASRLYNVESAMKDLEERYVRQIANALDREVTDADFEAAPSLNALTELQLANARLLSSVSTPLTVEYLREIVESASMRDALHFLDEVLLGGADPRTWEGSLSR